MTATLSAAVGDAATLSAEAEREPSHQTAENKRSRPVTAARQIAISRLLDTLRHILSGLGQYGTRQRPESRSSSIPRASRTLASAGAMARPVPIRVSSERRQQGARSAIAAVRHPGNRLAQPQHHNRRKRLTRVPARGLSASPGGPSPSQAFWRANAATTPKMVTITANPAVAWPKRSRALAFFLIWMAMAGSAIRNAGNNMHKPTS